MAVIRRLVLDVLIPLNIPSPDIALKLSKLHGVDGVDVLITAVEHKVEKAKITMEGDDIDLEGTKKLLDKAGVSLQGIDRITCGKRLVG